MTFLSINLVLGLQGGYHVAYSQGHKIHNLTFEEFEKAFKSVKFNRAAGYDDTDSNVIIKVYDEISQPCFIIFHSSFNEGIFSKQLKVAKVYPIFRFGNIEEVGN